MTDVRAPRQQARPETGPPRLREAQLALGAQAAIALLCTVLLLGGGPVVTAFAVTAGAAAPVNALLAVLLPRHPARLRLVALSVSWLMIPMFIAFSVPAAPALVGLASSAAVLGFLRPRFGLLRPPTRKLWLTLHVGFSVGWLGAGMAMLVLAIIGATTSNLELRHYAYEIMHIFDLALVIPMCGSGCASSCSLYCCGSRRRCPASSRGARRGGVADRNIPVLASRGATTRRSTAELVVEKSSRSRGWSSLKGDQRLADGQHGGHDHGSAAVGVGH
ncbi:MAG: hypothetical protein ACRDRU_24650, partial [Pseudonocardiaceae bacterium]